MEVKIIYKVCDIHAHIVPNIDDGAVDFSMAIELLEKASQQGTFNIVCSSHSYGNLDKYYKNLTELRIFVNRKKLNIHLHSGCEIDGSYDSVKNIIIKLENGIIPTMNGTKYVLVEFSPYESYDKIICVVNKLIEFGYFPIIAHVERYYCLHKNINKINKLKKQGCLFQVNAYSFINETKPEIRNFARKLLKGKYVTFIGSDAHRTNHRTYAIKDGIDYIYENCDFKYAQDVCYRNAKRILNMN